MAAMLLLVVWLARREGRKSAEARAVRKLVERARDGLEIDENVARLSDARLDGELRGRHG